MKKKSFYSILMLMAATLFTFSLTSCGDDETEKEMYNTPNWLLKTWQVTSGSLFSSGVQETYIQFSNSKMRIYVVPTTSVAKTLDLTYDIPYPYSTLTINDFIPSSDTKGTIDTNAGKFIYEYVNDSSFRLTDSNGTYVLKTASLGGTIGAYLPDGYEHYIY